MEESKKLASEAGSFLGRKSAKSRKEKLGKKGFRDSMVQLAKLPRKRKNGNPPMAQE